MNNKLNTQEKAEKQAVVTSSASCYSIVDILNCLPENRPLYKDSGLWQIRTDDMEDVVIDQNNSESFREFIFRYIELLNEFDKEAYIYFMTELSFKEQSS